MLMNTLIRTSGALALAALLPAMARADAVLNECSQPALETALALCLQLVHDGRIGLFDLVERLTSGPARIFGLAHGRLTPGAPADLVLFDPDERWTVDPARFLSKGRNTPLAGRTLRGRVRPTLVGATSREPVYERSGAQLHPARRRLLRGPCALLLAAYPPP